MRYRHHTQLVVVVTQIRLVLRLVVVFGFGSRRDNHLTVHTHPRSEVITRDTAVHFPDQFDQTQFHPIFIRHSLDDFVDCYVVCPDRILLVRRERCKECVDLCEQVRQVFEVVPTINDRNAPVQKLIAVHGTECGEFAGLFTDVINTHTVNPSGVLQLDDIYFKYLCMAYSQHPVRL
ncbi:hypothetical protein D3C71_1546390 [compost metagenome]